MVMKYGDKDGDGDGDGDGDEDGDEDGHVAIRSRCDKVTSKGFEALRSTNPDKSDRSRHWISMVRLHDDQQEAAWGRVSRRRRGGLDKRTHVQRQVTRAGQFLFFVLKREFAARRF